MAGPAATRAHRRARRSPVTRGPSAQLAGLSTNASAPQPGKRSTIAAAHRHRASGTPSLPATTRNTNRRRLCASLAAVRARIPYRGHAPAGRSCHHRRHRDRGPPAPRPLPRGLHATRAFGQQGHVQHGDDVGANASTPSARRAACVAAAAASCRRRELDDPYRQLRFPRSRHGSRKVPLLPSAFLHRSQCTPRARSRFSSTTGAAIRMRRRAHRRAVAAGSPHPALVRRQVAGHCTWGASSCTSPMRHAIGSRSISVSRCTVTPPCLRREHLPNPDAAGSATPSVFGARVRRSSRPSTPHTAIAQKPSRPGRQRLMPVRRF